MPDVQFRAGNYYHIYNRGINRGAIFFCEENYLFFLRRIRHYFTPDLVEVVAYCLMPTHYHLLVRVKTDDDFGLRLMKPLGTSYVKAVNKQQERVGTLFQGRYRAKLIDTDAYLTHLTRYIHLNPVQANYVSNPAAWPYSSFREYVGLRNGTLPKPDIVLGRFPSQKSYQLYVETSGVTYPPEFVRWLAKKSDFW